MSAAAYSREVRHAQSVASSLEIDENELLSWVSSRTRSYQLDRHSTVLKDGARLVDTYIQMKQALAFVEAIINLPDGLRTGWIYLHTEFANHEVSGELHGESSLDDSRRPLADQVAPSDFVAVDSTRFSDFQSFQRVLGKLAQKGAMVMITPNLMPDWDQDGSLADWFFREHFYVKIMGYNQAFRLATESEMGY